MDLDQNKKKRGRPTKEEHLRKLSSLSPPKKRIGIPRKEKFPTQEAPNSKKEKSIEETPPVEILEPIKEESPPSTVPEPIYSKKTVIPRARKGKFDHSYEEFLSDWESIRVRHQGQKEIIHAFFEENCQKIFLRIGRKGAKTSTIIDISWRFCYWRPKSIVHIAYPTKELAYDILWDEQRLQNCDLKDTFMREKYVAIVENSRNHPSITFHNGSKIKIMGTWTESSGRGLQPDLLIADEIQDCRSIWLDAAEPNLAAKQDSRFILSGTPPRKRNHYHEWEKRTIETFGGKRFHYSSYVNTALPHLKDWLDNKKEELYKSGKEEEWIREYLAEDCFSSKDRILPDPILGSFEEMRIQAIQMSQKTRNFIIGMKITETSLCCIWGIIERNHESGNQIKILDCQLEDKMFNRSFIEFYQSIPERCQQITGIPFRDWRKYVLDQNTAFTDVIPTFAKCLDTKGSRWNERGILILREMMNTNRLSVSDKLENFGIECQNYLNGDDLKDYPLISTIAMLANEYYQDYKIKMPSQTLSDTDRICDSLNLARPKRKKSIMSWNWK